MNTLLIQLGLILQTGKSISNYTKQEATDKKRAKEAYGQVEFKIDLPYAKDKLWKEIPYFGRFNDE